MAVKGSISEEPVAGKPHGGFCEGCRFLTKIVNIFKEEKDVYSTKGK
jgi:hypothetical protein